MHHHPLHHLKRLQFSRALKQEAVKLIIQLQKLLKDPVLLIEPLQFHISLQFLHDPLIPFLTGQLHHSPLQNASDKIRLLHQIIINQGHHAALLGIDIHHLCLCQLQKRLPDRSAGK